MTPRPGKWLIESLVLAAACVLLVPACSSAPSTTTAAGDTAKAPCVGCSVDGTTTPRLADGHPDFNGYWNGNAPNPNAAGRGDGRAAGGDGRAAGGDGRAAGGDGRGDGRGGRAGGGGRGQVMNRYADGSIIFDFSTEYNEENGAGRICQTDDCQAPNQPPYNDEWMVKVKAIAETQFGGTTPLDPAHACRPQGVPRAGINGVQIVHTPQVVAILYEGAPYSTYRLVYTDGRPHPEDLESSFWGHSIGHWEGDTLVVDTVGLTEESWVGGGGAVGRNRYTSIHSDKLHVTERFTREADVLTNETTVEDPVAFTKPWVLAPRRVRHAAAGEEVYENICNPNNTHFVAPDPKDPDIQSKCGYRCQDDAAATAKAAPAAMIAGTWEVTTRFLDREAKERWTIEQKGNAVTAKAAREGGELPVSGSLEGAFLRVTQTDGDKEYKVRATVDGDAMDGSITLGVGQQFIWHAKRSK